MKRSAVRCPRCEAITRSPVIESRAHDGAIWRRRICGACLQSYVTEERGVLRAMPLQTQSRYRTAATASPNQPQAHAGPPRGTGAHLQNLWSPTKP